MENVAIENKGTHSTVIAKKNITQGSVIFKLEGAISSIPDKYSIQLGENKHLFPLSDNPAHDSATFKYLNHSCQPNSYFDLNKGVLLALSDIKQGQEIRYDYCTTEFEISQPFRCTCGSENCLGEIKGYKFLSADRKKSIAPYAALHLTISDSVKRELT